MKISTCWATTAGWLCIYVSRFYGRKMEQKQVKGELKRWLNLMGLKQINFFLQSCVCVVFMLASKCLGELVQEWRLSSLSIHTYTHSIVCIEYWLLCLQYVFFFFWLLLYITLHSPSVHYKNFFKFCFIII